MIRIENDLQKELVKATLLQLKGRNELNVRNYMHYVEKMIDAVHSEYYYDFNKTDAYIEVGTNHWGNKEPWVSISCVGIDDVGRFITAKMENEMSEPFREVTIEGRDGNEIDTIEV